MVTPPTDAVPDGYEVIYRRYRRCSKTKRLLDARSYGKQAWRMVVKCHTRKVKAQARSPKVNKQRK